jgi:hypothetical protein
MIHLARTYGRSPRVVHRDSLHLSLSLSLSLARSLRTGFIDENGETESISARGALRAC